jgi:hypothetical protein
LEIDDDKLVGIAGNLQRLRELSACENRVGEAILALKVGSPIININLTAIEKLCQSGNIGS